MVSCKVWLWLNPVALLMQSLIGHFDLDPNRVFDIVSIPFLHLQTLGFQRMPPIFIQIWLLDITPCGNGFYKFSCHQHFFVMRIFLQSFTRLRSSMISFSPILPWAMSFWFCRLFYNKLHYIQNLCYSTVQLELDYFYFYHRFWNAMSCNRITVHFWS